MKRLTVWGVGLLVAAGLLGCGEAAQKKAWQLAFVASCKAQSNEAWMEEYCKCVGEKAVASLTIDQLKDSAQATDYIQKNLIAGCMPRDQVVTQWKEAFINSCVESGGDKLREYCECAAEKATTTWTNEQLMDEAYTSEHITEVSADCPKP